MAGPKSEYEVNVKYTLKNHNINIGGIIEAWSFKRAINLAIKEAEQLRLNNPDINGKWIDEINVHIKKRRPKRRSKSA